MFDISFTELMVVGAVALIVIGPEKLPKVARTVGHLVGRLQRYVSDVKSDINREMEFEELRNLRKEMNEAAKTMESTAREHVNEIRGGLDNVARAADVTAEVAADDATSAPAALASEPGGTPPAGQALPGDAAAPDASADALPQPPPDGVAAGEHAQAQPSDSSSKPAASASTPTNASKS